MSQIKKLSSLTAEQKKRMPEWVDKWIKIGLCTDEADWLTFERGVSKCYKFSNLSPDIKIIRVQNPLVAVIVGPILEIMQQGVQRGVQRGVEQSVQQGVWRDLGDGVEWGVREDVRRGVWDGVQQGVRQGVERGVWDGVQQGVEQGVRQGVEPDVQQSVGDGVRQGVRQGVEQGVWDGVRDGVRQGVWDGVGEVWTYYFSGQFWVSWQAYTSFFKEVCKLSLPGDLWERDAAYMEAQSSVNWWWPGHGFVVVSNRPQRITLNAGNRLHDYNRLAIEYRDGWGLASFNGVLVPPKYALTPADQINPDEVLQESNAEVRTAIIAKIGFARMLGKLPHKLISTAPGGEELIEFNINNAPVRGLHCIWEEGDGRHETVIPVWWREEQFGNDCPDNINDAEQVRRWTLGWPHDARVVAES